MTGFIYLVTPCCCKLLFPTVFLRFSYGLPTVFLRTGACRITPPGHSQVRPFSGPSNYPLDGPMVAGIKNRKMALRIAYGFPTHKFSIILSKKACPRDLPE